jgi:hypothetical protein
MEMAQETMYRMSTVDDSAEYWTATDNELEAFAALVREDERQALCKLMEDQNTWDFYYPNSTAIEIIRARGQA